MSYMTRLGLWGPGTPFTDFKHFKGATKRRGITMMQLVAMHLKSQGAYVCRMLSFEGASFTLERAELSDAAAATYAACCELWRDILVRLPAPRTTFVPALCDVTRVYSRLVVQRAVEVVSGAHGRRRGVRLTSRACQGGAERTPKEQTCTRAEGGRAGVCAPGLAQGAARGRPAVLPHPAPDVGHAPELLPRPVPRRQGGAHCGAHAGAPRRRVQRRAGPAGHRCAPAAWQASER